MLVEQSYELVLHRTRKVRQLRSRLDLTNISICLAGTVRAPAHEVPSLSFLSFFHTDGHPMNKSAALSFPDRYDTNSPTPGGGRFVWPEQVIRTKNLKKDCLRQPAPLPTTLPRAHQTTNNDKRNEIKEHSWSFR